MEKERLLAFTDGVIAVIITIMVLEMKVPQDASLGSLRSVIPVFLSYVLSFVYVAIYWNNHHHFFHLVRRVNGAMLWANINLLFWVSLVPFATGWMGQNHFASVPTALYGVALLMPALAWHVLQRVIIRTQGSDGGLARAIGNDVKGQGFAGALRRRHPTRVRRCAGRMRGLPVGGADVAHPRPADRKGGRALLIERFRPDQRTMTVALRSRQGFKS
jgi:uncharacterized membrane protein